MTFLLQINFPFYFDSIFFKLQLFPQFFRSSSSFPKIINVSFALNTCFSKQTKKNLFLKHSQFSWSENLFVNKTISKWYRKVGVVYHFLFPKHTCTHSPLVLMKKIFHFRRFSINLKAKKLFLECFFVQKSMVRVFMSHDFSRFRSVFLLV